MVLGDTWAGIECNIEPALLAAAPSGSNQHPISLRSLVPPRTPGSFGPQSSPAPHDLVLLLLPLCLTFCHHLSHDIHADAVSTSHAPNVTQPGPHNSHLLFSADDARENVGLH